MFSLLSDENVLSRIILIHPRASHRAKIVWELIRQGASYVAFDEDSERAYRQLSEIPHQTPFVVLDDCDRLPRGLLSQWLLERVMRDEKTRFVLSSRHLEQEILTELVGYVRLIPVDETRFLTNYTALSSGEHLLEVMALGRGMVIMNGREIHQWDGTLPRLLFFFFIDKGMVTRDDIFTTFWPDLSPREATNVFHVTKRKVSEILGVNLVTYRKGYYYISEQIHLRYDVRLFTQLAQELAMMPKEQRNGQKEAILELYQGHFLADETMDWVAIRRGQMMSVYAETLELVSEQYEKDSLMGESLLYRLWSKRLLAESVRLLTVRAEP